MECRFCWCAPSQKHSKAFRDCARARCIGGKTKDFLLQSSGDPPQQVHPGQGKGGEGVEWSREGQNEAGVDQAFLALLTQEQGLGSACAISKPLSLA